MKSYRGFTIIEIMISIAILGILLSIALPALLGKQSQPSEISMGFDGMTEARCVAGYKFVIGQDGSARQIMDEHGRGVRCD